MTESMAASRDGSPEALRALARKNTTIGPPVAAPFIGVGTNKAYELSSPVSGRLASYDSARRFASLWPTSRLF